MSGRRLLPALFLVAALLAHLTLRRSGFSLVPVFLTVPLLLTWLFPKPAPYLLAWAVIAELLTTFPPGVATLIAFLPVSIRYLFRGARVDLSFSFLLICGATVSLQTALLMAAEMLIHRQIIYPSYSILFGTIGLSTLFGYSVCLIDQHAHRRH